NSDPGKRLENLIVIGHGAPGSQNMGAGQNWDESGLKSIALSEWYDGPGAEPFTVYSAVNRTALGLLSNRFAKTGKVILGGCEVAGEEMQQWGDSKTEYVDIDGKDLLVALSNLLGGVAVRAGDKLQENETPGIEGTC